MSKYWRLDHASHAQEEPSATRLDSVGKRPGVWHRGDRWTQPTPSVTGSTPSPSPTATNCKHHSLRMNQADADARGRDDPHEAATAPPTRAGRGPKRKLPKMSPSERAKYYRQRVCAYTTTLEAADEALAHQVERLTLLHAVQQRLIELQTSATVRRSVLTYMDEFLDTRQSVDADHMLLSDPCVTIIAVDVHGDATSVIVRIETRVEGGYTHETIEQQLYPFVPGNARLLDKLLRTRLVFLRVCRWYFDGDGSLTQETHETDVAAALVTALDCSAAEAAQLLPALARRDRDQDGAVTTTSSTSANTRRLRPLPCPTLALLGMDAES